MQNTANRSAMSQFSRDHPLSFYILGVFNKSIFFRLDRICEDCYSLFREVELHSLCKWVSNLNRSSNIIRLPPCPSLYPSPPPPVPYSSCRESLSFQHAMYHATNIRLSDYLLRCGDRFNLHFGISHWAPFSTFSFRFFCRAPLRYLLRKKKLSSFHSLVQIILISRVESAILKISHCLFTEFCVLFRFFFARKVDFWSHWPMKFVISVVYHQPSNGFNSLGFFSPCVFLLLCERLKMVKSPWIGLFS